MKNSGIGGQAVMEGVMMKNGDRYAIAVRKPDKEIDIEIRNHVSLSKRYKFCALPIIRGIVAFIESLTIGVGTLTHSASFFEDEDEVKPQNEAEAKKKKRQEDAMMAGTVVLAVILAVGIFMLLPYFLSRFLQSVINAEWLLVLCEGIIRVALFIAYIAAISKMKDIERVFMYHGAEHKSINCIENGLPLTVKNVRKQSRMHKRCGTSFLLYIMVISLILFMFIRFENTWMRLVSRLVLIPIIAGISYEFIKLAGRSDNKFVIALSKPGLALQRLTTREPDDSMIEVAIASVEAVFDWKDFLAHYKDQDDVPCAECDDNKKDTKSEAPAKTDKAANNKNNKSNHKSDKRAEHNKPETVKAEIKEPVAQKPKPINKNGENVDLHTPVVPSATEDEDDEVLSALDKYFVNKNAVNKPEEK